MYLVFMNNNMEPGFLQSSYKVPTKTFCHMFWFFLTYYTQKKNLVCWPHRFHYFFWQGLHWSRSRHKQHFLIFVFGKKKKKRKEMWEGVRALKESWKWCREQRPDKTYLSLNGLWRGKYALFWNTLQTLSWFAWATTLQWRHQNWILY